MILVDTSVWVDHFREADKDLDQLLLAGDVACHPFILGELACGGLRERDMILALLAALPTAAKADDAEILAFIDRHRLMGKGIGLVDVHLLAACMLEGIELWTHDKKLAAVAGQLGVAWVPKAR